MDVKNAIRKMISTLTEEEFQYFDWSIDRDVFWAIYCEAIAERSQGKLPQAEVKIYTQAGLFVSSSAPAGIEVTKVEQAPAYVLEANPNCPFCDSSAIDSGPIEVGGNKCLQYRACVECDGEWTDEYQYISYLIEREPNGTKLLQNDGRNKGEGETTS